MSTQPAPIPEVEIYKQQYAHFGRMNDLIYKLPTLYSALIGALWYFAYAAKSTEPLIATAVFAFAAVVCLYSILVTNRFRLAFNLYLDRINTFDGPYAVTIRPPAGEKPGLSTLRAFVGLLWVAFIISAAGGVYVLASMFIKLGK